MYIIITINSVPSQGNAFVKRYINGAYQYQNHLWIIGQSNKKTAYSVQETTAELGLAEHGIYKRIEQDSY